MNTALSIVVRRLLCKDLFLDQGKIEAFHTMLQAKSPEERAGILAGVHSCNLSYSTLPPLSTQELQIVALLMRQIRPYALDVSYGSPGSSSRLIYHDMSRWSNHDELRHLSINWQHSHSDSHKPVRGILAHCSKSLTSLKLEISALRSAQITATATAAIFPLLQYLKYKAVPQRVPQPAGVSYWYVEDIVVNAPNLDKLHVAGQYTDARTADSHMQLLRCFGSKLRHLQLALVAYTEIAKKGQPIAHICPNITTVQIDASYPDGRVRCADLTRLFPRLTYLQLHNVTPRIVRQLAQFFEEGNAYLPRLESLEILVRYDPNDIEATTKRVHRLERVLESLGIRFKIDTMVYSGSGA